jgi:excinuclease UvrABC ATPase subunit
VLAYHFDGKSISDVLAMTVAQSLEFFTQLEIVRKLQAMSDVGLDQLTVASDLIPPR